jgi:anti-sigma factor RsiW
VDREIECREVVELLTGYLEGELDDARAGEVEQHLRGCPGCLAYVEQMRTTIAITGALGEGDVPDAVMDELLAAFRTFKPPA